ncbi:hypothetical protein DFH06DRAFT_1170205 [Mycena polygramma]|nr:hypothetical protein DFH06DRAFT_1170205 [Mycena polygramma]
MAARMARIITPTYVSRVNAQLVYPAPSQVVKPHELLSALARPFHVAHYEPERDVAFLAASLAYGLILGHPFLDGNKRTAFFIHNQYRKACGLKGLTDVETKEELLAMANRHIAVACGTHSVNSPEGLLELKI